MNDSAKIMLAKRIKELRESKGISQRELANKLNTGNSTISNIERSKGNPTIGMIDRIAVALEVSVIELLNFTEFRSLDVEIISQIEARYPSIPERYLKGFSFFYTLGIKFSSDEDYNSIWKIMKALEAHD